MTLSQLVEWVRGVPGSLPEEMRPMAESICEAFQSPAKRLMDLGLGYLTLDRSASTLSTGERQRMSWPALSAIGQPAFCMCWTSRPSVCTRPIL